jgi:hypothetical protein
MLSMLCEAVLKVVASGVAVQCEPTVGLPNAIPITPSEEFVASAVESPIDEFEGKKETRSFEECIDGTGFVFMWNGVLRSGPPDVLGRTAMFGCSRSSPSLETGVPVWYRSVCV